MVIAFIPGSTVTQVLPAAALSGLDQHRRRHRRGRRRPSGWVPFRSTTRRSTERLLQMLTEVPGLLLIAEIGRRMAKLVRAAQDTDPFTTTPRGP